VDAELDRALRDARATLLQVLDGSARTVDIEELRRGVAAIERIESALHAAAKAGPADRASGGAGSPSAFAGEAFERAALERRVQELSRALALSDEFLSTLGHELRNPLAPIYMQAQYLLDALRGGAPKALSSEWMVPQLEGFCRRLQKFLEMLNRIMDVSRMSAGQLDLELEEVDLVEVVREVAGNFERELSAARSELRLDLPQRLIGSWDRMRVEQIVTNLLSNAIRYGASKPIDVRVGGDLEQVELSVQDQGVGIAEEHQQKIFERFERAGKTRSSGGFGIGLWTVRQSCLAMGGRVTVQSQPGHGSQFTVVLPRVTHNIILLRHLEVQREMSKVLSILKLRDGGFDHRSRRFRITDRGIVLDGGHQPASSRRTDSSYAVPLPPNQGLSGAAQAPNPYVLIIDDEFGLAELIAEVLAERGYTTAIAINGELGLALVRERRPDLVLLDLMMPVLAGPEMLRQMRSDPTLADIPVVIMTALPGAVPQDETLGHAAAVLQKPFTPERLFEVVRANLSGSPPAP
jgi:signal transduction histidine kinase